MTEMTKIRRSRRPYGVLQLIVQAVQEQAKETLSFLYQQQTFELSFVGNILCEKKEVLTHMLSLASPTAGYYTYMFCGRADHNYRVERVVV